MRLQTRRSVVAGAILTAVALTVAACVHRIPADPSDDLCGTYCTQKPYFLGVTLKERSPLRVLDQSSDILTFEYTDADGVVRTHRVDLAATGWKRDAGRYVRARRTTASGEFMTTGTDRIRETLYKTRSGDLVYEHRTTTFAVSLLIIPERTTMVSVHYLQPECP